MPRRYVQCISVSYKALLLLYSARGSGNVRPSDRRIGSGRIVRHESVEESRGGGAGGSRREIPQLEQLRKQARDIGGGGGNGNRRQHGSSYNDRSYSNRRDYDYRDDRDEVRYRCVLMRSSAVVLRVVIIPRPILDHAHLVSIGTRSLVNSHVMSC